MYSIGTLGFADMDVQANYMLAPQYIGNIATSEYIDINLNEHWAIKSGDSFRSVYKELHADRETGC